MVIFQFAMSIYQRVIHCVSSWSIQFCWHSMLRRYAMPRLWRGWCCWPKVTCNSNSPGKRCRAGLERWLWYHIICYIVYQKKSRSLNARHWLITVALITLCIIPYQLCPHSCSSMLIPTILIVSSLSQCTFPINYHYITSTFRMAISLDSHDMLHI